MLALHTRAIHPSQLNLQVFSIGKLANFHIEPPLFSHSNDLHISLELFATAVWQKIIAARPLAL